MSLNGKTMFISGGSRGIGLAIALRAARDGANVTIAAKTADAASEAARHHLHGGRGDRGGRRQGAAGRSATSATRRRSPTRWPRPSRHSAASTSASTMPAPSSSPARSQTDMKRYDLMHQINTRGTFLVSKMCIPHLKKAANPHILNLAPPLDMEAKWFKNHVAYTMAKFGMSMCTLGMSAEFAKDGIAVNSLWPLTAIDTAAVRNLLGGDGVAAMSRSPEIMADAAYAIFNRPARETTGNFFIDEEVLKRRRRHRLFNLCARRQGPARRRLLRAGRGVRIGPRRRCRGCSGSPDARRVSKRPARDRRSSCRPCPTP